jgi:polar amino acid transport system permease protein
MNYWSWTAFLEYIFHPLIIYGAWTTLWLTTASVIVGLIIGILIALLLISKKKAFRNAGRLYVWFWRGTPLLAQLVIIYTALPLIGIKLSVVLSALIGLGLNEGAFMAEIVRAGVTSINKGQTEAAKALGMTNQQLLKLIIFPQAFRFIVPAVGNRINGMLKMSSLASVISMEELLRQSQMLIQEKFAVLEIFIIVTLYYLMMTTVWGRVQARIEAYYGRAYYESRLFAEAR